MKERRSFAEHVQLFAAYGAHVAQLRPASWDRLRLRCVDLSGPTFRSLLRRARFAAKPQELYLSKSAQRVTSRRLIAGASRVVQTTLAFAFEVAAEFDTSDSHVPEPPARRTHSTGDPTTDRYIHATFLIGAALVPIQRTDPGVATAVYAAGQAVLRHDWLLRADFEALYAPIESEIPFASLESPSNGTRG